MSEQTFDLPNFSTDLTGEVALVTGTTAGLGMRFALVLAKCGAKVALTGLGWLRPSICCIFGVHLVPRPKSN